MVTTISVCKKTKLVSRGISFVFLFKYIFFTFVFLQITEPLIAQNQKLDSLYHRLTLKLEDTSRVNTLNEISVELFTAEQTEEAHDKATEALNLAQKISYFEGVVYAKKTIGNILSKIGRYSEAIDYFTVALKIYESLKDKKGVAHCYNSIGIVYGNQSRSPEALENYFFALKIYEELGDDYGICNVYNNMGTIYQMQGSYEQALENYKKSLLIRQKLGDKKEIAKSYNNIAIINAGKGDFLTAIENFKTSLEFRKEVGDLSGTAASYNNIGLVFSMQENYEEAIKNYLNALEIIQVVDDKILEVNTFNNIGELYLKLNQLKEANKYITKALSLSLQIGNYKTTANSYDLMSRLEIERSNFEEALKHYQLSIAYRDSISNEENTKKILQAEMKYGFDKKMMADSINHAKSVEMTNLVLSKQEKDIEQKRIIQYVLFGGLFLVIIFAVIMYNRFKITQKQKGIIEKQKRLVEEKQKEIVDSIKYAKRIQNAILPPKNQMGEYLSNSFVLYLPKDIVAGDFYWLEKRDNLIFFAAADCTGHGVPGAMVSVVCNNGLNRSVREYEITAPGKILEKTREIIILEFEKSDDQVNDGMDISLCVLDASSNKLLWAGANNPIWIIRNNENQVEEIKPNKQAIGKIDNPMPYDSHTIDLSTGDTIYIFTDGYPDQFGGEDPLTHQNGGKKLKYKPFKQFLLSIQEHSMEEQKILLNDFFFKWKGDLEQVDDVCVIGVRI